MRGPAAKSCPGEGRLFSHDFLEIKGRKQDDVEFVSDAM